MPYGTFAAISPVIPAYPSSNDRIVSPVGMILDTIVIMFRRIYLDNAATTPIVPEVLDAMLPYLTEKFGNASSIHFFGQETRSAIDRARHQAAALINSRPAEIVFTSGGTESNNLAIRGFAEANRQHGDHVVISAIEHPAAIDVCGDLEDRGFRVTRLPVSPDGVVSPEELGNALSDQTIIVSVMTVNNEIGTVQPVDEIGKIVRTRQAAGSKIRFHTDAVQAVGKIPIDVEAIGCDLLTFSGHKINAPKGVGALYVRRGTRLHPQNIGGRQERAVRAGTENVAGIVAFGRACEIVLRDLSETSERIRGLRDRLESGLLERIPGSRICGADVSRAPGISNVIFGEVEGEGVLINLDMQGVAVSTGSACSSGSIEPSPVILALGIPEEIARGAVRFSFGPQNGVDDVDRVLELVPAAVESLRRLSRR